MSSSSALRRLLQDNGWPSRAPRAGADRPALRDEQLMAAVKVGSIAAFNVLYDRYCDRVYRVARSVCRDDGRAQDAVEEAFVSIWRARGGYDESVTVAAWVLSVARTRAIDVAGRNQPHLVRRADDERHEDVPAAGAGAAQAGGLLGALAKLPDAEREIITLACHGQLTHTEIAAHLNLPVAAVKGRMHLALDGLRGDVAQVSG